MQRSTQRWKKELVLSCRIFNVETCRTSLEVGIKTKLNERLAKRQMADIFEANISANKISLPEGQSYTGREYYNGS